MASIQLETRIARSRAAVWDAIRDIGNIHQRLVPGFVVDCKLEGKPGEELRLITFGNGMSVRELIVSVDDARYRHAYAARGELFTHHNASIEVFEDGAARCRVVWIADLLPNTVAGGVEKMMQQGLEVMKRTLEGVV